MTVEQLRGLLAGLRTSEYCRQPDLADPFTILIATGLRRGELLALRCSDYDEAAGTLTVSGKIVRVTGRGLTRDDDTKSAADDRGLSARIGADQLGHARPSMTLDRYMTRGTSIRRWLRRGTTP